MLPWSSLRNASFACALLLGGAAHSAVQIDIFDDGTDVQMELSGSFDLTGGVNPGTVFDTATAGLNANRFFGIRTGQDFSFRTFANTGPSDFGPGDFDTFTALASGDTFFFNFGTNRLGVATDYVSGAALSASATFEDSSLNSLGLSIGSYTWDFTNGEQINLTVSAVPLPAGGLMLLSGLAALGFKRKARKT